MAVRVHCVLGLLGEEAILAEHHGTPCCCSEAELKRSHGTPANWNRIASPLPPLRFLSLQLLHKCLILFKG